MIWVWRKSIMKVFRKTKIFISRFLKIRSLLIKKKKKMKFLKVNFVKFKMIKKLKWTAISKIKIDKLSKCKMSKQETYSKSLHSIIKRSDLNLIIFISLEWDKIFFILLLEKTRTHMNKTFKGSILSQIQILKKLFQEKSRPKKLRISIRKFKSRKLLTIKVKNSILIPLMIKIIKCKIILLLKNQSFLVIMNFINILITIKDD